MSNIQKITILHNNDMHGDFLPEEINGLKHGGVALLSGYVSDVRRQEDNVIYAICGDMFRGSVIDQEYRGLSTIEILNLLDPDVVTLGNHEVDYGLTHLLFVEKCARFPIINANMYITINHVRLFNSHVILQVGDIRVLLIGILTEEVLNQTRLEGIIGSLVDVNEAANEVGRICNAYRNEDIDLTILMTHIGHEEDKQLATKLDSAWGVDLIIGGHSHTTLEKEDVINGIPIAQAGSGTDNIGRFDLEIDLDNNNIVSCKWQMVSINSSTCNPDEELEALIIKYQNETDVTYARIVTRFEGAFTHPIRNMETSLGNLYSDILRESLHLDIALVASGSIRSKTLGPIVEYSALAESFPFEDPFYRVYITGDQLKHMMHFMLRDEMLENEKFGEFYQFSEGFEVIYNRSSKEIESIHLDGKPLEESRLYKVGMHMYHLKGIGEFLDMPLADIEANGRPKIIATNSLDVLEEHLSHTDHLEPIVHGRLKIIN